MEINSENIETVVNQTYPGLTMYVRDTNLSNEISKKYKPGLILLEKAFCDASNRVMGMVTTHRYGILSNHMADLSQFDHGPNWGLHVSKSGSRFKVLENYECKGKTLILLLHLPDDETWKLFEKIKINIDDDITASSIERFEEKCLKDPIPELATIDWLQRCQFPVGMDEGGNWFAVE